MSRRSLTLAVVAIASLVVSACSSSPTAPESRVKATTVRGDDTAVTDTTARSGWMGSNG